MTPTEVPPRASSNRRIIPPFTDGFLAVAIGLFVGETMYGSLYYWPLVIAVLLGVSFSNHVLLTIVTGGSIGKLITGLRIVRTSDLEKPTVGEAVRRWLWGFVYIAYSPILFLTGTDMDHLDIAGLRIVRRVDVRRAKG